jgi:hypothetical protein
MYRLRHIYFLTVLLLAAGIASAAAPAPDFSWARRMGGSGGGGDVTRVAMDAQENVYAVGVFKGQTAFGTNVLSAATNGMDSFISKLDRNGNWLWTRQITQSGTNNPNVRVECAAVDSVGAVIVTGETLGASGNPTLFGTNSVGVASSEIFVAKYSSNGECLWARGTGGFDPTYTHGAAVDGFGNIYVSGIWSATNQFLALKLDTDGNELLRIQADSGYVIGRSIQADAGGNVYICGALDPPARIQSMNFTNSNSREAFVLKFNSTGTLVWAQEGGRKNASFSYDSSSGDSWAYDLALDSRSNVLACGWVLPTNLFGISVLNTNYNTNAAFQPWLLKLTTEGNPVWLKTIPVTHAGPFTPDPAAWGVGLDAADAPYIVGIFGGTAYFDSTALNSLGNNNIFLAKYDSAGILEWATQDGTTNNSFSGYDHAARMAVGATGFAVGGRVPATGSFGSITFTNPPGWEMFVARIDFPAPSLGINAISTNVHLCWPVVPSGYTLESTTNLTQESVWQMESSEPIPANGTNYLSLPNSTAQQFFRLHRP